MASVNSCFMTTFLAIAENSKLEVVKFHADAEGKLERVEGQGSMITVIRCHSYRNATNGSTFIARRAGM